jgi:hypothetical protein
VPRSWYDRGSMCAGRGSARSAEVGHHAAEPGGPIGAPRSDRKTERPVAFEEGANRRTGKLEAKNVTVIEASLERVRRYELTSGCWPSSSASDFLLTVDKLFSEQSRSIPCSEPAQNETFGKRGMPKCR